MSLIPRTTLHSDTNRNNAGHKFLVIKNDHGILRKSLDPLFVKKGMELCSDPVSGKQTKHA